MVSRLCNTAEANYSPTDGEFRPGHRHDPAQMLLGRDLHDFLPGTKPKAHLTRHTELRDTWQEVADWRELALAPRSAKMHDKLKQGTKELQPSRSVTMSCYSQPRACPEYSFPSVQVPAQHDGGDWGAPQPMAVPPAYSQHQMTQAQPVPAQMPNFMMSPQMPNIMISQPVGNITMSPPVGNITMSSPVGTRAT